MSGVRAPGVRVIGSGTALPEALLTNRDLEGLMETSDEWIVKRTGIRERRRADWGRGEKTSRLATDALRAALEDAGLTPGDLDLLLVATMTPDCPTPAVSSLVSRNLGCTPIGAMDLNAACSGYVYALSTADMFIRSGAYRTIGLIGADCVTRHMDYSTYGRAAAILFGDGAGAMVLRADEDPSAGMIAHRMHADGDGARHLFIPAAEDDFSEELPYEPRRIDKVQMNGHAVFKFAVSKFKEVIHDTLDDAGVCADEVDHFVCHQANARILEAARERFGIPEEKLLVNIDRYGNTVGASVPLVFDELVRAGRVERGHLVMFLAFGAGLTWASSLWRM